MKKTIEVMTAKVNRRSKEYIRETSLPSQPKSPMKAIRAKCKDCMGGDNKAIDECSSVQCTLWPFRFGFNPYREASEKQIEQGKRLAEARYNNYEESL